MRFLSVLEEIEYRGWLVAERETGGGGPQEMAGAVGFLRRFIG